MEDQEVVLVEEVSVLAPAVAVRVVGVVLQMNVAETAQAADHLPVQEADAAVVLPMDAAVLQTDAVVHHREEEAVLQAMEDVAAKKVILPQADEICINTIKEK